MSTQRGDGPPGPDPPPHPGDNIHPFPPGGQKGTNRGTSPLSPLPLVFYDDIKPKTDTTDFVENLLIEASFAIVYGESNSGKTFFALDLALHIAAGRNWRGLEVTQGAVVYCILEGSAAFANRVEAWRNEIGGDIAVSFAAIPATLNLLSPDADTQPLIQAIKTASEHLKMPTKLVVLDTLSRALAGGNENAPDDMGAFVANVDAIRQATGAAVLIIHHSGKDTAKGARGHSLLRAAADTEIEITANGSHLARVSKQRELEGGQEFPFDLTPIQIGTNHRGKPVTSCIVTTPQDDNTAPDKPRPRLTGHTGAAYNILCNLLASEGKAGFRGTPASAISVHEDLWRDRFYSEAMPGAEQDTKKRAFRRAADNLVQDHTVAMANARVWLP